MPAKEGSHNRKKQNITEPVSVGLIRVMAEAPAYINFTSVLGDICFRWSNNAIKWSLSPA
jgi:hypothetical protein